MFIKPFYFSQNKVVLHLIIQDFVRILCLPPSSWVSSEVADVRSVKRVSLRSRGEAGGHSLKCEVAVLGSVLSEPSLCS